MKAVIWYFSGTGNTKRIAEEYARAFETENVEAEIGRASCRERV